VIVWRKLELGSINVLPPVRYALKMTFYVVYLIFFLGFECYTFDKSAALRLQPSYMFSKMPQNRVTDLSSKLARDRGKGLKDIAM
jgi:hypothetical protein